MLVCIIPSSSVPFLQLFALAAIACLSPHESLLAFLQSLYLQALEQVFKLPLEHSLLASIVVQVYLASLISEHTTSHCHSVASQCVPSSAEFEEHFSPLLPSHTYSNTYL